MPSGRFVTRARVVLAAAIGCAASACAIALFVRVAWPASLIGWVCLVPWLAVLDRSASAGGAVAAGIAMSVAFGISVFPWFPHMIGEYTGAPWATGALLLVLLAPLLEPQFVTLALTRWLAWRTPGGTRWWLPALVGGGVYVGTEWAWPKLFADTLAHPLHASAWLRQAADLVGARGLTFFLILGNECVLAALRAVRRAGPIHDGSAMRALAAPIACLALLAGGLAAYGGVRLAQFQPGHGGEPVRVAMVQANLARYDRLRGEIGTYEAVRRILDDHVALSVETLERDRPDVLVWPETVYPTTFGSPKSVDGAAFDHEITSFVTARRVPLVFGTYAAQDGMEFNAAVLLEPRAEGRLAVDTYRKSRLFPFTERLPWPLESAWVRRQLPWAGTWTPGSGPRVLTIDLPDRPQLRVVPMICYDALDPDFAITGVRQGADALLALSNDSWFAFPGVQRLILVVSAFRSIETRRPQLRATPTGVSAVVDETGALRDVLDVHARGILLGSVRPTPGAWTLMLAWGDWLPPAALGAALLLLAGLHVRGRA